MSSSKGWLHLEPAGSLVPDTQFFEGDSAFTFLGLTRTQRLYGFVAWSVASPPRCAPTHPSPQPHRRLCAQPPRQHPPLPRPARQLCRSVAVSFSRRRSSFDSPLHHRDRRVPHRHGLPPRGRPISPVSASNLIHTLHSLRPKSRWYVPIVTSSSSNPRPRCSNPSASSPPSSFSRPSPSSLSGPLSLETTSVPLPPLLGSYSPLVQVLCLSKSRRHSPTPSDLFRSICHHRVPRIYLVLSFLHPVRTLCRPEAGRHELEH